MNGVKNYMNIGKNMFDVYQSMAIIIIMDV